MNPPPTTPTTLDGRSLAIGVLSITACILFVGLVLLIQTPPALGIGQTDRGGDYVMLTQQISSSNEGLVIVDGGSNRMVLYTFDFNQKKLALADGFELSKLRQNAEEERPRRRGR
ncbi:MAG: hypothetical protein HRU75_09745 [Planctomycetia bacterium]|nr:MAG: hypothetical protein HRU75_09745 [Planctomycetia bacterium]